MKKKRYYYLYKITNLTNKKIYIGVHTTFNLKDGYFGSGTNIIKAIKNEGAQNFKKEILEYFKSPKKCLAKEFDIVNEDFIKRKDTYNIILGGIGFNTLGCVSVKDEFGKTSMVNLKDPRYLNGKLVGVTRGKVTVKDKNNNYYQVDKNDPKFLSGELTYMTKGKIVVKDKLGKTFQVSKDDPRYLSGELVGKNLNCLFIKNESGKYIKIDESDIELINKINEDRRLKRVCHRKINYENKKLEIFKNE